MALENQRYLHEDLERLEQAIADRVLEDPPHIRGRLARDHEIARFLKQLEDQSKKLLHAYDDPDGKVLREVQEIGTGDTMNTFLQRVKGITEHHHTYKNEPVENLEKTYKKLSPEEQMEAGFHIDAMFTGEEGFGRFFDLVTLHEQYINLPGVKDQRRMTYVQYLDKFDDFSMVKRQDKMKEEYFQYLVSLSDYLEEFMRKTRPLENLDKLFETFDKEFEEAWEKDEVPGWQLKKRDDTTMGGTDENIWCQDCKKGFTKQSVFDAHLSGKKHQKAAAARAADSESHTNGTSLQKDLVRLKERAVAAREFRVKKLASAMQINRSDTKVNVERRQTMTERERQQELENMWLEMTQMSAGPANDDKEEENEGEEKIYNPLKLPLAWDGKPIPYWLYKLHGLGVEFHCEICGNFVYMGRRAFDKHFSEPRHVYGLRCLGITGNTTLFREISSIEEAMKLWKKIQEDQKKEKTVIEDVVQMEDSEGHVMPEKVYYDLQKQGLL